VCSTRYIDSNNMYDDAFVASLLCDGGAVAYEAKAGTNVSDEWLFTNVVPNIHSRYSNDLRLCRVLALAILWASFNDEARVQMKLGTAIKDRFLDDFVDEELVDPGYNPVQKTPLHIANANGRLQILKMQPSATGIHAVDGVAAATPIPVATDPVAMRGMLAAAPSTSIQAYSSHLMVMMRNMEQKLEDKLEVMNLQLQQQNEVSNQQYTTLNNNIRQYGGTIHSAFAHQARQQQATNQQASLEPVNLYGAYGAQDRRATLHPRPRDMVQLWTEWTFGIDGRKAAKDFTKRERNNKVSGTKQKFYRRLIVWQTQARLVDGGMSIVAANNRIMTITGASTLTGVISKLIQFKKVYRDTGGIHPQLRNG
jgi:hypothetical protein